MLEHLVAKECPIIYIFRGHFFRFDIRTIRQFSFSIFHITNHKLISKTGWIHIFHAPKKKGITAFKIISLKRRNKDNNTALIPSDSSHCKSCSVALFFTNTTTLILPTINMDNPRYPKMDINLSPGLHNASMLQIITTACATIQQICTQIILCRASTTLIVGTAGITTKK